MLEYIHDQFGFIGVGDAQFIAAAGQKFSFLLRVPLFIRNPAGTLGGKAQRRCVICLAGENAVAGGEVLVEVGLDYFKRGVIEQYGRDNAFQRKTAQGVALMAPGIQIPVIAVMREPLRGNDAPGLPVMAAD